MKLVLPQFSSLCVSNFSPPNLRGGSEVMVRCARHGTKVDTIMCGVPYVERCTLVRQPIVASRELSAFVFFLCYMEPGLSARSFSSGNQSGLS